MKSKHSKTLIKKSGMRKLVLIPLFLIVAILILFKTVFIIGYVPSESMEPTLKTNSLILGLRVFDHVEVGDIVIFRHCDDLLVKRVAAIGGQSIEVEWELYDVPEGYFFMLGDNSENSYDSRFWDDPYISSDAILAKLILP